MKRGFLNGRSLSGPKPSSNNTTTGVHSAVTPRPQPMAVAHDTTKLISSNPHIVQADIRIQDGPGFLYLPTGSADVVFIDRLSALRRVAAWPVWNQMPPLPSPSPCFGIREMPGKGSGMVATRAIKAGELIHEERPTYVMRQNFLCMGDQNAENGVFHRNALRGLSKEAKASILALKNSKPAKTDTVVGVLNTNYLEVDITEEPDPDNSFVGCFPTLSRANHSCAPSANYFSSFPSFVGQLWAVRDLAEGEEITITYCQLLAPRAERQATLAEKYFFTCACATCALPHAQSQVSDERRLKLAELDQQVESAQSPPPIPLAQLQQNLQWANDEGLAVQYARGLLAGATILAVHGSDRRTALQWAANAREAFRQVEGDGSYNVRHLSEIERLLKGVTSRVNS